MGGVVPLVVAFLIFPFSHVNAQMVSGGNASGGSNGAFEPSSNYVENNGLAGRVLFVGSGGKQVTVSVELKNAGDEAVWIALIGPAPTAIDTSGNTYAVTQFSGIGACNNLAATWVDKCITNRAGVMPSSYLTTLSPQASSLVNFTLQSKGAAGPDTGFLSLTMNIAVARGNRPAAKTDRVLASMPLSFPLISLETK